MGVLTFGECEGAYEELMKVSRRAWFSNPALSFGDWESNWNCTD